MSQAQSANSDSSKKPRRRLRPALRIGLLLGLATALTLGLLEVTLRFAPVPLPHLRPLQDLRGCYRLNGQGRLETVPGWTGSLSVDGQTNSIHMNSLGLRGPDLPPRVPGERRVLMLGDSYVMGYGVADDETIPAILERELNTGGGPPVHVGNAGMLGTGPREWAHTLARFRSSFAPDLVVACCYAGNDPSDTLGHPLSAVDGWLLPGPAALLAESSWRVWLGLRWRTWLFLEVNVFLKRWPIVPTAPEQQVLPAALPPGEGYFLDVIPERESQAPWVGEMRVLFEKHFADFRQEVGALPVLVVVLPGREASSREKWRIGLGKILTTATMQDRVDDFERGACSRRIADWARQTGLPVLDLTQHVFDLEDSCSLYLPEDYHYNRDGCRQVAAWIRPAIVRTLGR